MFLLFQAIVLGLVQGLTELLPVSSTGHRQGVPYLLGWESGSPTFQLMLRVGTLAAIMAYFRSDLWYLASRSIGVGVVEEGEQRRVRRVVLLLAIGSAPAIVAGALLVTTLDAAFESIRTVALSLYASALILVAAEVLRRRRAAAVVGKRVRDLAGRERHIDAGRREDQITARDVAVIGLAQAAMVVPGMSRSGVTIAAGMAVGLSRAAATRFSCLLAMPILLGATVARLPDVGTPDPGALPFGPVEIAAGALAAALGGYWAIHYLLRLVEVGDLLGFARYVAVFATLLLVGTLMIG